MIFYDGRKNVLTFCTSRWDAHCTPILDACRREPDDMGTSSRKRDARKHTHCNSKARPHRLIVICSRKNAHGASVSEDVNT